MVRVERRERVRGHFDWRILSDKIYCGLRGALCHKCRALNIVQIYVLVKRKYLESSSSFSAERIGQNHENPLLAKRQLQGSVWFL